MSEISTEVAILPLAEYAGSVGKSLRTVQRWLADGQLPEAFQDDEGRWWVPAGTRRRTTSQPVAAVAEPSVPAAPASSPVGYLVPLEEYAAALGTTVGGVRRMGRAGLLEVGPYGPNGALRVYAPPK